ncbi:MAG: methyltransferase domain-containing protein [Nitrososphaera sp.]
MCAEDRSVYLWSIFGPAEVDTYGLNEGRTYCDILKIPSARYDAVSCFVSLEHCIDPALIVKAACQALTPKGLFVASVPAVDGVLDVKPHHTWYWAGWSLQRMLKCNGFSVFASLEYANILYVLSTRA